MAITLTTPQPAGSGFAVNGTSADLSACEILIAAPATGVSIYLERVSISCAADIDVTIGEGETTGDVTTEILGPVTFKAAGGNAFVHVFRQPIKLTAATALTCDASGAGQTTILVEGYIE